MAVCLNSSVLDDTLEGHNAVSCLLRSSRNQTSSLNYWCLPHLPSENLIPLVGAIWYKRVIWNSRLTSQLKSYKLI